MGIDGDNLENFNINSPLNTNAKNTIKNLLKQFQATQKHSTELEPKLVHWGHRNHKFWNFEDGTAYSEIWRPRENEKLQASFKAKPFKHQKNYYQLELREKISGNFDVFIGKIYRDDHPNQSRVLARDLDLKELEN